MIHIQPNGNVFKGLGCCFGVEHLPSINKALRLILDTEKKMFKNSNSKNKIYRKEIETISHTDFVLVYIVIDLCSCII